MAMLPTVPAFVANDTSVTKLSQLSQAVSFLIDLDVRPAWHFYKTVTAALINNWNTPGYTTVAFDSDGVQSSGSAVIVTQGYYICEGCAEIFNPGGLTLDLRFQVTFGANNPHHTNGTTLVFGQRGGQWAGTNADPGFTIGEICPAVLYPGDKVDFQVFSSVASTLNHNANNSSVEGRFVANFTGYFLRTGS